MKGMKMMVYDLALNRESFGVLDACLSQSIT
jgi:hypothetical protein